jgi:hypothetical protein
LEGDKNERKLNRTKNLDRPIQEKESKSDDAPIRNKLTENNCTGIPHQTDVPSPKLK